MAKRKVDVAIIGAGTAGLAAYRRVRGHTAASADRGRVARRHLRQVG